MSFFDSGLARSRSGSQTDSTTELLLNGEHGEDTSDAIEPEKMLIVDVKDRNDRNSRLSFSSNLSAFQDQPKNSARLTCFLLLNNMIGSGILNQPYVFMTSGYLGALLGFAFASVGVYVGLIVLTEAGLHANVLEYSGLAAFAFPAFGESFVDVVIVMQTLGAQLGYILVVGSELSMLLESWGCEGMYSDKYIVTVVAVSLFVAPVCMLRHFGHLAWLSLFSVGAIVACLLLVLIGGPLKREAGDYENSETVFNALGAIQSTGSIVFSLSCASANFQAFISTERKSRNMSSWHYVSGGAVGAGTILCVLMGLVGYYCFGEDTEGMILDNFPGHAFDFFKLMVVTHLILYIPVNFIIMRYSVTKILFSMRSEQMAWYQHFLLTIALLVGTTLLVMLMWATGMASGKGFSLILNLTGGVAGSLSTLILPAALYLKVMPSNSSWTNAAQLLFLFGVVVMVAVVIVSIISVM